MDGSPETVPAQEASRAGVSPGTDGALAMAMGHVVLKEFFVDRQVPRFVDYVKRYTDLPFLLTLTPRSEDSAGGYAPGKFLTAADLGDVGEGAEFKTVLVDSRTDRPHLPNGTLGDRFTDSGKGRWNLDLGDVDPLLMLYAPGAEVAPVDLARFDTPRGEGAVVRRGVPVRRIGKHLVTTVYDLLLAQFGVARPGLPGEWPAGLDDPSQPSTPAWQEQFTGVPAAAAARIGREFAQNAEDSGGRSMIIMGAGTNHWFHSDTIYRPFLTLTTLTGCQGVNGGGWAHYVGQEKCRPVTGWMTLASALDWARPPRQMIQTAYWYLHTDQWRYDRTALDGFASPLGRGRFAGKAPADVIAQSARMGRMPSHPTFDCNPLDLADDAASAGKEPGEYVVDELRAGRLRFACEDPDAPENFPRVLTVWPANLLGSSARSAVAKARRARPGAAVR